MDLQSLAAYGNNASRRRWRVAGRDFVAIGTKTGPNGGGEGDGLLGDLTHLSGTSRLRIDMPSYDVEIPGINDALVPGGVEYWNGYIKYNGAAEANGPNAINVKAAWEPAGAAAAIPLYAAGNRTNALAAGARLRYSPLDKIIIPSGSLPFARQFVSVDVAAQQWPSSRIAHISALGESENTFGTGAGTDQSDAVGAFGSGTASYAFGPCGIYGVPADRRRRPIIGLMQDSMGTVSGEDASPGYGDANGFAGWLERSLGTSYAVINAARASARLQWTAAGFSNQLALMAPYITHLVIQLSANDWSTARTSTQMLADLRTIIDAFTAYGVKVWVCTSTPKVTATANAYVDGGTTAASGNAERETYNTELRANYRTYGAERLIDIASKVEDPARAGRFLPSTPALTTDGTHLSATGRALVQTAIDVGWFN